MAGKIKVPSELVPSQSNKIMLRSKYIYDDVKGHTQEEINQALEEQIEDKVIEAGGVNWDTVPTAGSNNAVKSKDIKAALEKVTGYFVLDSNVTESTVVKTVTVADFPALAIGGSIKIKMLTKNTAANPTLKIGPAGATAYPLYYNEERASANNSWEANEIISVFFDGTNYRASNSQGGSNKKIDAYLLGDLRTLSVGETYAENEAIKTSDKQLLRVTKDVKAMNLTDEVASGDLKTIASGTYAGTYRAQKNIKPYTDAVYADGDYALGSPAGAVIQVSVDSTAIAALEEATNISVTIAGIELTVAVDSTMDAVAVAAAIVTAFGTQSEWKLVDNSDGTIDLISKIAKTEAPTISSDTGETGVTVGFVESSDYAGTTALSKYDGTSWTVVADLDTYASDFVDIGETDATKMWKKLDVTDLVASYTKQNSVADDFLYNSNAFISENLFNLEAARISNINNNSYSTKTKDTDTNTIQITVSTKDKNNARSVVIWPFILKAGKKYRLSFTYANGMNAVITPTLRSYNNALIGNIVDINNHTLSLPIGSGSVDCIFIPKQNSERLCITYPAATGVGRYIRLKNLFIGEVYSVTELAEKHNEDIEKSIKDTNNIIDINPMSYNKSLYIEPDYTWNKSTTGYSHYGIPAKSEERFIITPGERITQYGFLTSPNGTSGADVTTWLPGYETLYTIHVGETKEIIIPENGYDTIYIYILHLNNSGAYDYTPASIQKYVPAVKDSEAIHNNLDSLNNAVAKLESTVTRLDLTEKDEDGITYKTYSGNPLIPVYNKFGWKNIGPNATYRTEQACSIWGDYAFGFNTAENTGSCALDIVNLKTRKTVGAYKGSRVYNIPTDGNYHMGSSQFSNIYYDENDEFPLIYIQGITNNLIVGRVVPENSAQLYHIEIVQVIDISGITDNNATYHVAFDHTRGYLVLFHGVWMKIKTLLPPAIKDGSGNYITNVSITDEDFIEQYEIGGYTLPLDVPQSGSCHNGLLFYTNGIVRTEQRLVVIDLRTHNVVNDVSTWQLVKDAEPESIDFWGEIPILFTREGMFRLWF